MATTFRNTTLVATLMLLAGCATKEVAPEEKLLLSSQPHMIAIHYPPQEIFSIRYSGGGLLAAGQAVYDAARLTRDLRLEDPAPYVKDRLMEAFKTKLNVTNVRTLSEYPRINIALEAYKETFQKAIFALDIDNSAKMLNSTIKDALQNGVVLDVQTRRWMLDGTRVLYSARARLFKVMDSVVIWQRNCAHSVEVDVPTQVYKYHPTIEPTMTEPSPQMWMMEHLEANDGTLLKAKLREAVDGCADKLFESSLSKVR